MKEVQEVVRKSRSRSAPGPSGVLYKVYKYYPRLLKHLWKILRVAWRRGKVAQQWIRAEGVWIPKEEDSKKINQFRMISLLNTEGKILFSIVLRRLGGFLSSNNYIDTLVQKGDAAHPGSKREQGRHCSPVVRPSQCIWLLPLLAGQDHHDKTPCV